MLDRQGQLWAFWEEHVAYQAPDRGYDWVHYRVWDGQSWSATAVIYAPSPEADSDTWPPALAIGPDGSFHVVWMGSKKPPAITGTPPPLPRWVCYSRGDDNSWSEPQTLFGPVTVGAGSWYPNLAVASDGTAVVVWGDVQLGEGYRAYVTWGRDGKWVEPMVLSPEDGDEHMWPVVAVDAEGRVHVIWKARAGVYHVIGTVRN